MAVHKLYHFWLTNQAAPHPPSLLVNCWLTTSPSKDARFTFGILNRLSRTSPQKWSNFWTTPFTSTIKYCMYHPNCISFNLHWVVDTEIWTHVEKTHATSTSSIFLSFSPKVSKEWVMAKLGRGTLIQGFYLLKLYGKHQNLGQFWWRQWKSCNKKRRHYKYNLWWTHTFF